MTRPSPTAWQGIQKLLREQGLSDDGKPPEKKGRSRGQHTPGVMNSTEAEYSQWLDARKLAGEVKQWFFEEVTFTMYYHPTDSTRNCRLTLDFMVVLADGTIEMIDVKGSGPVQEDSAVKIKMAAGKYPQFKFFQEQKTKSKGWKRVAF